MIRTHVKGSTLATFHPNSTDNKTMHAKPPTSRVLKHGSLRRLGGRNRYLAKGWA